MRAGVVQSIVIDFVSEVLEVVFDGDDALDCEILDLLRAVLFPVLDVGVVTDTQRSALDGCVC